MESVQEKPSSGFLLVHKPSGMTSHDVVDAVRRARGTRRVGHAGTLDPMATGLLIIGVGEATKDLGKLTKLPKTYVAELTLGATSTTDDAEGIIEEVRSTKQEVRTTPTRTEILSILQRFYGEIEQVPPAYSAVKVRGVRAYRRARRGEHVILKPRQITVHAAELSSYAFPLLTVRWTVSSGTYIRALARDIGSTLGTGAYLSKLERTAIGPYGLRDAITIGDAGHTPLLPHLDPRRQG
jgi:tRNA pseudouridine55 synthase